jgi:hypothetical protein
LTGLKHTLSFAISQLLPEVYNFRQNEIYEVFKTS